MTCIVVLGMHRSGTSLVANILHELGVDMGSRFREADTHNPYGYYEDLDWRDLNKKLLNKAGGTWWQPPTTEAVLKARFGMEVEIAALIDKHPTGSLWGFKDPRTMLTIPAIHSLLPDPLYICIWRREGDVIASLMRRAELRGYDETEEHWRNLVDIYLQQRTEFLEQTRACFYAVTYENLLRDKKQVDGLALTIGVKDKERIMKAREVIRG